MSGERRRRMLDLWWQASSLHIALRRRWVVCGHFGSPQEARLFRLQWRAYEREMRRGAAYDREF